MLHRNAIVVVVDRLGAGLLGPYGNTWLDAPNFNRLSAESFLFEFPIIDSPRLDLVYRSYWQGLHAMCSSTATGPKRLPQLLAHAGVEATLITDEPHVSTLGAPDHFSTSIQVHSTGCGSAAQRLEQTQLAQLFSATIDQLATCRPPFLLWIHARGLQGPWDAPQALREQFADEEDPVPPDGVDPPARRLADNYDPDEMLAVTHSCAGQVAVLDLCLGAFLDAVAEMPQDEDLLLVLTSPRGYPLGEHHRIGMCDEALYGELVHVPWIMRFSDGSCAAQRSHTLIQPHDLYATLVDWFGVDSDQRPPYSSSLLSVTQGKCKPLGDRACCLHDNERAIRTPAWFLRNHASGNELYVKPDDRWEVNEIGDRCHEVTDQLLAVLDEFHHSCQSLQFIDLMQMPEMLLRGASSAE